MFYKHFGYKGFISIPTNENNIPCLLKMSESNNFSEFMDNFKNKKTKSEQVQNDIKLETEKTNINYSNAIVINGHGSKTNRTFNIEDNLVLTPEKLNDSYIFAMAPNFDISKQLRNGFVPSLHNGTWRAYSKVEGEMLISMHNKQKNILEISSQVVPISILFQEKHC